MTDKEAEPASPATRRPYDTSMSEAEDTTRDRIIDGRYRILRKVAEGGMATVYEALDERLNRHVAVKVMHTQLAQGPHRAQFEERFRREAQSAAAIANPHIVQVYDTGLFEGLDYLVMEYVHGISLRQEMGRQVTFNLRETMRILGEILDGLSSAHQAGVVHRDIKPENILLNDRGHVEITDFGLARAASQATLSSTGMLLGTAAYLAPETIENNQATPQGDLYAVGIMAYEMLTGTVPFASQNPVTIVFKHVHEDVPALSKVCPGIDPAVSDMVTRLTSRSIAGRPKDATQALQELNQVQHGLSMQALQFIMPAPRAPETTNSTNGVQQTSDATADGSSLPQSDKHDATTDMDQPVSPAPPVPAPPQTPGRDGTDRATSAETRRYILNDVNPEQTQVMSSPATNPSETIRVGSDPLAPGLQSDAGLPAEAQGEEQLPSGSGSRKKGKRALIIALIVILVLALAGGGGGSWWYFMGPGSYHTLPKPDDISCAENQACKIIGADFAKYSRTLKVAGIEMESAYDFSDSVAKGAIMAADPDTVGARISKRMGRVKLTVSKGVREATVPENLLTADTAEGKDPLQALKTAGFSRIDHDQSKDQYSMDIPEGAAISVDPAPGTRTRHDTQVTLVLSKGKMPVAMPDVVGKSREEAKAALEALRLTVNYREEWSDKVPRNRVVSASHQAQEQLHWGDTVDVVVSKGPQAISMPDVKGKSQDEATRILEGYGLKVNISAPLGNLTHTVRIQDPEPGSQVKVVNDDGSPAVVTLTVV